jgi:prepilin-type N-terminal cleavage/methylation domain-containing protein/prepilin-type processing-associated H-X9-DG protein
MPRKSKGFTLMELLVVVAVIAILAGLLLPALENAKRTAQKGVCINNFKQLELAFQIYPQDFNGRLVINGDGDIIPDPAALGNWVVGLMGHSDTSQACNQMSTNLSYLSGHKDALFTPYIRSPQSYKCPSDRSTVQIGGRRFARVRSYSMDGYLGYYLNRFRDLGTTGGRWIDTPDLNPEPTSRYYDLEADLTPRRPENIWTFIDEQEDSIFCPAWRGGIPDSPYLSDKDWIQIPGSRHTASGVLAFADGHVETKRWQSVSTKRPLTGIMESIYTQYEPGNTDLRWLATRYPPQRGLLGGLWQP